jgi:TonB family protein
MISSKTNSNLLILLFIIVSSFPLFDQTTKKRGKTKDKEEGKYNVLDKAPEFLGGLDSRYSFIGKNLKYPESAIRDEIEGKVIVLFIIDITGKVTSPEIIQGIREDLDKSALELVNKIPNWRPAEINGEKVKGRQSLPLNYNLTKQ